MEYMKPAPTETIKDLISFSPFLCKYTQRPNPAGAREVKLLSKWVVLSSYLIFTDLMWLKTLQAQGHAEYCQDIWNKRLWISRASRACWKVRYPASLLLIFAVKCSVIDDILFVYSNLLNSETLPWLSCEPHENTATVKFTANLFVVAG